MPDTREFRVVWKRASGPRRQRVFRTRAGVERFFKLFGPEPWTAYAKDPDAYQCCPGGRECGCDGLTVRQFHEKRRAEPHPEGAIEYARIEQRRVGPWKG